MFTSMADIDSILIGARGAAAILGLSESRVRAMDAELRPLRLDGWQRVYSRAVIESVAAQRKAPR